MLVGADGCKEGRLAVAVIENDKWGVGIFREIGALLEAYRKATLILIDVPISLPDTYGQKLMV